ncbi:MAG: hypothetical protein K9H49_19295 [Bacteroidales bacterium]|nr:hypothetical protein [Bacteroidales bacterium]MCF8391794.1 hypothetical protein [Bacteroidales bacterium]
MNTKPENKAYKDEFYPPIPTKTTKFFRKFFPFQIYKFFSLNYKIMKIVVKGHS